MESEQGDGNNFHCDGRMVNDVYISVYVLPAILRFVRVRAKFAVNFSASTSYNLLEFLTVIGI